MIGGVTTLTGSLDLAELAETDPSAALAAAVAQWWRGDAGITTVLAALRPTTVLVEVDTRDGAQQIVSVRREGLSWVPVCTGLTEFAHWMQACGRGTDTVEYGRITGADLLDAALPQLPRGTGLVLNPCHERVMALPPVTPVVPPEMALTVQET